MFCQNCGNRLQDNTLYCIHCGTQNNVQQTQQNTSQYQTQSPQAQNNEQSNIPNQSQYYSQNQTQNNVQQTQQNTSQYQSQPPLAQNIGQSNIPNQSQFNPQYQTQSNSPNYMVATANPNYNKRKKSNSGIIAAIIISVVFFSALIGSVVSCQYNKSPSQSIVGTWTDYLDSYEITFSSDGRVTVNSVYEGTYSIDSDNTLHIYDSYDSIALEYIPLEQTDRYENRNPMDPNSWWYLDGDTLYIGGKENVFYKQ